MRKSFWLILLWIPVVNIAGAQSLAEAARIEAERRKNLEQRGVEGKVILWKAAGGQSKVPAADPSPAPNRRAAKRQPATGKSRASAASFRSSLQKLDREIGRGEDQLKLLQKRIAAERWAPPKTGRITSSSQSGATLERLTWQLRELEVKLRRLRRERLETYDAGRKAGFLPGELDGKGIIP